MAATPLPVIVRENRWWKGGQGRETKPTVKSVFDLVSFCAIPANTAAAARWPAAELRRLQYCLAGLGFSEHLRFGMSTLIYNPRPVKDVAQFSFCGLFRENGSRGKITKSFITSSYELRFAQTLYR